MGEFLAYPTVERNDQLPFDSGHIWIHELVTGDWIEFRLSESGLIHYQSQNKTFTQTDVPPKFIATVNYIENNLQRDVLYQSLDRVNTISFQGIATYSNGIDYNWNKLPPFLGVEVIDHIEQEYKPPAQVHQIYDEIGLAPLNVITREVHLRDFHPERYSMPQSNWYDGPVYGVLLRDKGTKRAVLHNESIAAQEREATTSTTDQKDPLSEQQIKRFIQDRQVEMQSDLSTVADTLVAGIIREHYTEYFTQLQKDEIPGFRSTIVQMIQEIKNN
ncbi:MAG: hypothetical protein ABEI06_07455 [Halobacteriaceae archaeon]